MIMRSVKIISIIVFVSLVFMGEVFAQKKPVNELDVFLEAGEFDRLNVAVQNLSSESERRYWLGKESFYKGDYAAAVREMELALKSSQNRDYENLKLYYQAIESFNSEAKESSTEHFILHLRGPDGILYGYAAPALEKIYSGIGKDLGCFPADKVIVEVYSDKKQFALASTLGDETLEKSGTIGICKFNRIMILSPGLLPTGYRWLDTLAHEYTHFLVNRLSRAKCPLWLHEGIAHYYETLWRLDEPAFLGQSTKNILASAQKSGKFITFKRMYPSLVYLDSQDEMALAFAEAALAVDLLRKSYSNDIIPKLLEAAAGADMEKAFNVTIRLSQEGFEKKLFAYLKGLKIEEAAGALNDQVEFTAKKPEDDYIGADEAGLVRLGDKMREINRPDAALIQYRKALEAEPANPLILTKAARCYLEMEKPDDAITHLKAAVEKNPNYVTPFELLGEIYFSKGSFTEAVKYLEEAIAINPFDPHTHFYLIKSYLALGDLENAKKENEVNSKLLLQ
jgi:tetratricopeptide (TPR) repeat protein